MAGKAAVSVPGMDRIALEGERCHGFLEPRNYYAPDACIYGPAGGSAGLKYRAS